VQPERTDADLIAAIADGDRAAFGQLYRRHAPWLLLRLSRRCADAGLVDEVVQDTFVAVWRSAKRWDSRGEVPAWLWGIGIRRLLDTFRRQPRGTLLLWDEPAADTALAESAEEQVLLGVEYGDLGGALDRLAPELRAVVQATILDGLTTKEAARLLGIPAGTVKTRMMRARATLREEFT